MAMSGTIFNTCMIIAGSIVGSLFKKGINERYHTILLEALGLCVLLLGVNTTVSHMSSSHYPVLFIASLAIGGLLGTWLDLEGRFDRLLTKHSGGKGDLAQGLATGILLYCIGTLSIVGPMQAALKGDTTFLMTNGMLDGITSTVLASTFGIGMIAAAPVLFCWQGGIFLLTLLLRNAISSELITEITIVGGVLIFASGLSLLGIKKCHTLNLLPALLIPVIFLSVWHLF